MDNYKVKCGYDVVYLAACALHQLPPTPQAVEEMDLPMVYKMAVRHSMDAITAMALTDFEEKFGREALHIEDALLAEWKRAITRSIRKTVLFEVDREKLFAFLEKNEIWYLPLKGIILQNYYPKIGMRQMVDNDILFDKDKRSVVRKYMEQNGYKVVVYGKDSHDIYTKLPVYDYEMHVYLYTESLNSVFFAYYQNVKERLVKDAGKNFGYRFTDEDFYIHCTSHSYRHYYHTGGVGIRSLMDIYVYMAKMQDKLDFHYMNKELKKLKIAEFEKMARELSQKLFFNHYSSSEAIYDALSEDEKKIMEFYIGSGAFGTVKNFIDQKINAIEGPDDQVSNGKSEYIRRRIFPNLQYYKENYPIAYRYKVLLPFFWLYRILKAVVTSPRRLFMELRYIRKK